MYLRRLRLRSFRAHAESALDLTPKVNLVYGPNGAGKTNLLEAIHYLGLSKSFLATTDAHAVRRGATFFETEGTFETDRGGALRVRVAYATNEGKRVFVNGAPLERMAELVGRVPIVALSPADYELTAGGPEERRRFLDATLSQSTPVYLDDLIKYRRALKQRNALLHNGRRGGGVPRDMMEAWDAELAKLGARLIVRRARFLEEFAPFFADAFHRLGLSGAEPEMDYRTVWPLEATPTTEEAETEFIRAIARVARRERDRGRTLVGPHLDEVVFSLNTFEVRPYASQGQHRAFGLALRLASFFFLRERLEETPILLLDDVFGPLDETRSATVLQLLQSDAVGQSIVSAARPEPFVDVVAFSRPEHQTLAVADGRVWEAATAGGAPIGADASAEPAVASVPAEPVSGAPIPVGAAPAEGDAAESSGEDVPVETGAAGSAVVS
jgi:DNA replication and repair protein RecF